MHALIPAPDGVSWDEWRRELHRWREATRFLLNYDDAIYRSPDFAWVGRTFNLAFVMMCDLLFYDGGYREFLAHGEREFGGYDALILWHAYPRIGFDDRNQFDFYRQMPGGLARLRQLVDDCHARNVRVYVDYNPWDTGSRRETVSDIDALVELVRALDADAIFLDTLSNAAAGLREKLDAVRPGVSLESEVLVPLEHLHTHPSSWAQGFVDVPGVLRNKWFERRHMQHRIRRWQHDHTPELHTAWMNGTGMVIWENVFGSPVRWCERDKSLLRSMIGVQRRYHALFAGEGWKPYILTLQPDIYASQWDGNGIHLWTLTNSGQGEIGGDLLRVPHDAAHVYFDLMRGEAIIPRYDGDHAVLSGHIPGRGIGALLSVAETPPDLLTFLAQQADLYARANFDATPPVVVETLRPALETIRYQPDALPAGMVTLPAHSFDMRVTFTIRECGFYEVPGVTFPDLRYHNLHRPHSFTRPVTLKPYALDLTPVTNAQFAEFLRATGYTSTHRDNFLLHWHGDSVPAGLEDHPVVYVSLEDARAYAHWAGKRLPTEEEWQFAAQGVEGRRYPWGDLWQADHCNHGQYGTTTPVARFPQGRSACGCYDLCGNVWEWTESERTDGRTRFAILKGGSFYRAHGSEWYADGGAQANDFAAKFLLMYPGLDRCATIGFRCAVDLA
ncbi:MAG: SUMF1/EgtB/PvdO family nonheme iron enzyme [Anaerolinea sp.]|nr:SUMF1/EgtB/PvdO family nonheme iron enzyme [Anaerolinea sp.]